MHKIDESELGGEKGGKVFRERERETSNYIFRGNYRERGEVIR